MFTYSFYCWWESLWIFIVFQIGIWFSTNWQISYKTKISIERIIKSDEGFSKYLNASYVVLWAIEHVKSALEIY